MFKLVAVFCLESAMVGVDMLGFRIVNPFLLMVV